MYDLKKFANFQNNFATVNYTHRRFQQGVKFIRGDEKLFQGKLLMIVKDVPESDAYQVATEFGGKVSAFIGDSDIKDDDAQSFVLQMYKLKPNIRVEPYPPLTSDLFFPTLSSLRINDIESIEPIRMLN